MTGDWLAYLKRKAVRKHVWYRILPKIERSIVDLTIRCVDRIRSSKLALIISRIVCKLLKMLKSKVLMQITQTGYNLADKISRIAVNWGYEEASAWKLDKNFARYLGVTNVNNVSGWF
ncbi:hypothetical protein KAI11_02740 [Candidatus Bathyarchaeota archaeon]|nr:hypothetical protein [Candidatus Bathyarchaeota archaeon]